MFKMAEQSDDCSDETLLAPCTKMKRLQRRVTKGYYWTGVQEKIGMFSNLGAIIIVSFSCLCLKDQLGLCSLTCHTHVMTGNCSASWRVLANSLRVVSAKRGNRLYATVTILLQTFIINKKIVSKPLHLVELWFSFRSYLELTCH